MWEQDCLVLEVPHSILLSYQNYVSLANIEQIYIGNVAYDLIGKLISTIHFVDTHVDLVVSCLSVPEGQDFCLSVLSPIAIVLVPILLQMLVF